jgi:O-antigen ligase
MTNNNAPYYLYFIIALLASIYLNPYISIVIIVSLVLLNKNLIYPILIILPLIEVLAVFFEGFTITKAIGFIYLILFLVELIRGPKKILLNKYTFIFIMWVIVVSLGLFNAIVVNNYYTGALNDGISRYSLIIFAMFLYFDFAQKNWADIQNILYKAAICISLSLLIISVYISFNPMHYIHYGLLRTGLTGADYNEFSSMIAALLIFPIYLFHRGNGLIKTLSIIALTISIYILLSTLSRGGIYTLAFTVLISLIFIFKVYNFKRNVFIALLFILIILPVIYIGFIELDLEERFFSYEQRTTRWEFQSHGIESTINNNFFLGYGGVKHASRSVNLYNIGNYTVMHSIFIGLFVEYGLVGFMAFMIIIITIASNYLKHIRFEQIVYSLPFLSLYSLLFAGIALEWAFRELIWIFVGINFGLISSFKQHFIKNIKDTADNKRSRIIKCANSWDEGKPSVSPN